MARSPESNSVEPEPEIIHLDTKGKIANLGREVA